MPYIEDLTDYAYAKAAYFRSFTKAIGWLDREHKFKTGPQDEEFLGLLWQFCKFSVAQSRGLHKCEFCPSTVSPTAERNGEKLILGTAEIRVFGEDGIIYAAPTLIYHYVALHQYTPPEEFVRALKTGPSPPNAIYFDRLRRANLTWNATTKPLDPSEAKQLAAKAHAITQSKLRRRRRWLRWQRLRKFIFFLDN